MKQDIEAVYRMADEGGTLAGLMEAICGVLQRHPDALRGLSYRYRLAASDTGYTLAFALNQGVFALLDGKDETDVTVMGKEADLLLVFRRKLPPLTALLKGKIKLKGSKAAVLRLAEFL